MNRHLIHALVVCLLGIATPALKANDLFIAFWNVENLFDTFDDPEFTPTGPNKWTKERLETNLAKVITKMNGGKGPNLYQVHPSVAVEDFAERRL